MIDGHLATLLPRNEEYLREGISCVLPVEQASLQIAKEIGIVGGQPLLDLHIRQPHSPAPQRSRM
ncbi:hypothetical protein PLANTIT3_50380 [Plantibacter sp. T3]|nr:hypothetical protein PLANTIT3_50380 [Plantibacter sp. T3]